MTDPRFKPGFRLSPFDVLILVAGAVAAAAFAQPDPWVGGAIAFVVAHFFLFCNVLRMSRPLELLWATAFAALAIAAVTFNALPRPAVFALSSALTLVLTLIETRRPSYHGVAWRRLNPGLPEWWAATHASK